MKARVLTGSKQEIARKLAMLDGDIREAIVLMDEPTATEGAGVVGKSPADTFAEMEPYTVRVADFDDSREAIYERLGDE